MQDNIKNLATKLYHEIKKYWEILYNSIAIKIIFFVFLFLITLLLLIPLTFDNSLLKFSIIQKISRATEADFDINGEVEVNFFPTPTVILNEAVLLNYKHKPKFSKNEELFNFYAKRIKIKFSFFSMSDESLAKEIEFDNGFFEVFSDPKNIPNRNNKITEILVGYKKLPSISPSDSRISISNSIFKFSQIVDDDFRFYLQKIPSVKFNDCAFSFFNRLGKNKDFSKINANFNFAKDYNFGEGSFLSENVTSKFEFQAIFNVDSMKPKSYLFVSSPNLEIKIKGNFNEENKGFTTTKFNGDMFIKINELKSFYQTYLGNEKSPIFSRLKSNTNSIIISSDIENEEKELNLKNISIDSSSIKGNGNLYFAIHNETPIIDIDLDIGYLDADSLISQDAFKIEGYDLSKAIEQLTIPSITEKDYNKNSIEITNNTAPTKPNEQALPNQLNNQSKNNVERLVPDIATNINNKINSFSDSSKDFDVIADIKIKELVFFATKFKDCDLYFSVNKTGEVLISPAIIKTPGEGSLFVRGTIQNTGHFPKFIGIIDFKGKKLNEILKWLNIQIDNFKFENLENFRIYSNLFMVPNYTALDEVYFNLNNGETEFFGETKIIRDNKNSTIVNNYEITNLDFNKHIIIKNNNNFFDSSQSLIKKSMWLNNISSINQISLNFNRLVFNEEEFLNQKFEISMNRGFVSVDNLHLMSDKTDLNINLLIDIADKTPNLYLKLFGTKLNINNADNPNQKIEENQDKSENVVNQNSQDLINISKIFKKQNEESKTFFDKFYTLPSLETFNGLIDINIGKININNKTIDKFTFKGDLKNGTIQSANLNYNDFNGSIDFKGILDIKTNKIINGLFSLKNVNLEPLLKEKMQIENIGGIANITGNVLSIANSKKEFFKDLKSEIKFSINQPVIKNLGLNDLINKMFNPKLYQNELQEPEKIIFNSDSKTIYNQAKGNLTFKNSNIAKLRFEFNGNALNSLVTGELNCIENQFDLLYNSIFLTGNSQKPTPINLAIKMKGSPNQFSSSANTNQIRKYLGLQNQSFQAKFSKENSIPPAINDSESKTDNSATANGSAIDEKNKSNENNEIKKSLLIYNNSNVNSDKPIENKDNANSEEFKIIENND
ncbi:hypothetical protein LBMAG18_11330 [Alphaproteobacteria bacterium]|nr:hypothetical protein LBMAG18_11330 [Alphaproteobacteria bacterium]